MLHVDQGKSLAALFGLVARRHHVNERFTEERNQAQRVQVLAAHDWPKTATLEARLVLALQENAEHVARAGALDYERVTEAIAVEVALEDAIGAALTFLERWGVDEGD